LLDVCLLLGDGLLAFGHGVLAIFELASLLLCRLGGLRGLARKVLELELVLLVLVGTALRLLAQPLDLLPEPLQSLVLSAAMLFGLSHLSRAGIERGHDALAALHVAQTLLEIRGARGYSLSFCCDLRAEPLQLGGTFTDRGRLLRGAGQLLVAARDCGFSVGERLLASFDFLPLLCEV
jgi:hypothetical protein